MTIPKEIVDYYGKYYYPTEKGNYFWFDYSV